MNNEYSGEIKLASSQRLERDSRECANFPRVVSGTSVLASSSNADSDSDQPALNKMSFAKRKHDLQRVLSQIDQPLPVG